MLNRNMSRCLPWYVTAAVALAVVIVGPRPVLADNGPEHQTTQTRPIQLGTSGGNIEDRSNLYCCSGTLGALVQDTNGTQYILSNNHVLAKANYAVIGDDVNQPGQIDQNCGQSGVVADLADYVPLLYGKGRNVPINTVDAAIAAVRPGMVDPEGLILDIGPVSANTRAATVGLAVQKSGRTTGHTIGSVINTDVTVDVGYSESCGGPSKLKARFVNQIRIDDASFSAGGDSGSLIVESGSVDPANGLPRAVGLLFAGSSSSTLANPIDAVLSQLNVSMVQGTPPPPPTTGTISGYVTRAADSGAIGGAAVTVDTGQSATTDGNGFYTLSDVPTGTRVVTASALGYSSASQTVTVNDSANTAADFALNEAVEATQALVGCVTYTTEAGPNQDKHLVITVSAVDDLGNALAGATVSVNVSPGGTGSATTDSNGEVAFSIKNAADVTYTTTVTDIVSGSLVFDGSTPANSFVKGTDATPASFCSGAASSSVAAGSGAEARNTARNVSKLRSSQLFSVQGVVGHGLGANASGAPVIVVYLENENAASRAQIPANLDGVPVQIEVTGPFTAF